MLAKLKFGQKIALLPGVTGLGAVAILVTALVYGGRSSEQLRLIQEGYYPSTEMSQQLENSMERLQRSLQDAVAASDQEALAKSDSIAVVIRSILVVGRENPLLDAQEIRELERRFEDYYALARGTTVQMITGSGDGDLMVKLGQMTESIAAIKDDLAARSQRDVLRIEQAFSGARRIQRSGTGVTIAVLILVVALLAVLSWRIIRDVLGVLRRLSDVAVQIQNGRIDQTVEHTSDDEVGVLAEAFRSMIDYLRDVAGAAASVARGDLSVEITPRSEDDELSKNMALAMETLREVVSETGLLNRGSASGQSGPPRKP